MKNRLPVIIYLGLLAVVLLLCVGNLKAQMLETVDFSPPGQHYNNYVNGINNKGFVCGYYTLPGGTNLGFVISNNGKKMVVNPLVIPAMSGYTDTKVTGINDHGVALIYASNGSGGALFKAYIDSALDSIANVVAVNNVQEPSSISFKINNKNDMTGWFQASTRFLFSLHDSLTPAGCNSWEGFRYTNGGTDYNTFGSGVNDNNEIAGYYVDAPYYCPFVYDNIAHTFTVLNTGFYYRLQGINNNEKICGDYKQGNGVYMAFYATYSGGGIVQLHSLASIFMNNMVASVANGINDNGNVAGNFTHPNTGASVGFIYHPNVAEYRIPGFDFAHNTWSMLNNNIGVNPVYTSNYWGDSHYLINDPYANITDPPLLDTFIRGTCPPGVVINFMTDSVSPSWKGFGYEIDVLHQGTSNIPFVKQYYANITKHDWWNKYRNIVSSSVGGYCYGFSYSTLLRYFNDTLFSDWFNMPVGTDISQVTNDNINGVMSIERCYMKQMDQATSNKYGFAHYLNCGVWEGMYRLKNTYSLPFASSNPRSVAISFIPYGTGGYHNILPYKIRTPRVLPFDYPSMQYDTLFIYDSNYPGDSSQHFTVKADVYDPAHDSVFNSSYTGPGGLQYINFNKPSVKEQYNVHYAQFKTTNTSPNSSYINFSLGVNSHYNITDTGNTGAQLSNSGFNNTSANLTPLYIEDVNSPYPNSFNMDSNYAVSAGNYNYNNEMLWSQSNTHRSQTLSRAALPAEADYTTMKNRFISYGTHDAASKMLTGSYTETTDDYSQGSSILVSGICAAQNDSIITKNPYPYAYQIIRLNGQSPCTYTLTVFAAYGDTVKEFHAVVDQQQNSSHIIDPYYTDQDGHQHTVIYVDNGNTGTNSDTLFISGWPVDIQTPLSVAGISVRPNPVYRDLNIDVRGVQQMTYHIALSDITGRMVYGTVSTMTNGTIVIPMDANKPGMYIVQIANDKGAVIYHAKVSKE